MKTMTSLTPEAAEPERMQCMEVWGGNGKTHRCFAMPGLKTWVSSVPHSFADSGGDLFYVSSCASGRITRLLLADVSGHGPSASEIALGLRGLMRQNVNMIKQDRLVEAMNRQFSALSDCSAFATAIVGTFFAPKCTLAICNAGHPCPLVYRQREKKWQILERRSPTTTSVTDIPLGVLEDSSYSHHKIKLELGDMVFCYSDALTESYQSNGQQLGESGVAKLAGQLDAGEPELFIIRLLELIEAQQQGNLEQDDVTAVLLQVESTKPRLQDNLAAPFRLFRRAAVNEQL